MNLDGSSSSESRMPIGRRCCLSFALLAVFAGIVWIWIDSQRGWTKGRLERLIQTELPAERDRKQVEMWFDRHRIQHQYFRDTTGAGWGKGTMAQHAGLRDE